MKPCSSRAAEAVFLLSLALALPVAATGPDPTPRACRLVAEIRAELQPVENQIRNHPYLAALERGQVSLDNLRAFAGEQYNILRSDLRSDAQMVTRFGATPGAPFFVDLVNGESIAIGLMLDFAAALGRSEADLQAYEPRPRGQTYPSFDAWLGFYGSDADIAAAYLVNFPMFGENAGRIGRRAAQPLRLHGPADRFLRLLLHPATQARSKTSRSAAELSRARITGSRARSRP